MALTKPPAFLTKAPAAKKADNENKMERDSTDDAKDKRILGQVLTKNGITGAQKTKIVNDFVKADD